MSWSKSRNPEGIDNLRSPMPNHHLGAGASVAWIGRTDKITLRDWCQRAHIGCKSFLTHCEAVLLTCPVAQPLIEVFMSVVVRVFNLWGDSRVPA